MIVFFIVIFIAAFLSIGFMEMVNLFELGTPIPEQDIADYIDKLAQEGAFKGLDRKWNDKFKLTFRGWDKPSIHQTQWSLLFPYYISDVGVIPVWSTSYKRIKTIFDDLISQSQYTKNKRRKLGLK